MESAEWSILVERINGLWPPAMSQSAIGAYFDELQPFTFEKVLAAIRALAKSTTGPRRPSLGALYDICQANEAHQPEQSKVPDRDLLDDAQHRFTMLQLARMQTPEHKRRLAAVLAIGRRLTLTELQSVLSERACSTSEFEARLAQIERRRPSPETNGKVAAPRQRMRLESTDPDMGDEEAL